MMERPDRYLSLVGGINAEWIAWLQANGFTVDPTDTKATVTCTCCGESTSCWRDTASGVYHWGALPAAIVKRFRGDT